MSHIREDLTAVMREIHRAEHPQYRQDADYLLASPVIRHIQSAAWLEGHAAAEGHGPSDCECENPHSVSDPQRRNGE